MVATALPHRQVGGSAIAAIALAIGVSTASEASRTASAARSAGEDDGATVTDIDSGRKNGPCGHSDGTAR